jgi:iron complex outermembrane receptor protein
MVAARFGLALGSIFTVAYAATPIYEVPPVSVSAAPPFLYQQSALLGNQVIIAASQIARSNADNLGALINNIAGIQYISGLAAEPQILIHSEPAMILINGQALTNFSMSTPDINLIPLSEIEKIIITPGVAGSTYGNQSLGGVINIITKQPREFEQHISVSTGLPWMNQIIGVSAGPINAQDAYRADIQNEFDEGYRGHNRQNMARAGMTLEHDYASGALRFDMHLLRQSLQLPGYLTDVQAAQNPEQSIANQGQGTYRAYNGLLGLLWTQNLTSLWQAQTQISYRGQNADSNLNGMFTQNYNTEILNPELQGDFFAFARKLHARLGVFLSNESYNFNSPTLYSNINGAQQQQYSPYASLDIPLTQSLTLSGSGRLVAVETSGQFFNNTTFQFNPESSQTQHIALATVGLRQRFNQQASMYVRRAMGYQLPFIDQANFTANPNTGFGLQATTATAYETGVNWNNTRLQMNAEAFVINLSNEIGYFAPPNGIAANYNLAPTRREGTSIDGSYALNLAWTLGSSVTLMNNRFRSGTYTGNEIPGASNVLLNFNAHYQINPIWSLYLETQYTGAQFAQGDNANVSQEIPGYWLTNLAVNAEFSQWLLSLRLDNITDTSYYLATVYDQYLTTPHINDVAYYPAPARTVMVSLTYRFD